MDKALQEKFDCYPSHIRPKLKKLRGLILDVAARDKEIGELEECLKWGEPSYLTSKSKSGTTLRFDWKEKSPQQFALYVNCKTTLIDSYRSLFPELSFEGNRAVFFDVDKELAVETLSVCIRLALRYKLDKKTK